VSAWQKGMDRVVAVRFRVEFKAGITISILTLRYKMKPVS